MTGGEYRSGDKGAMVYENNLSPHLHVQNLDQQVHPKSLR